MLIVRQKEVLPAHSETLQENLGSQSLGRSLIHGVAEPGQLRAAAQGFVPVRFQ